MYLHIGQNEILPDRRVIGIFDLDKCSYGKRTREYLAAAARSPSPSWCVTTPITGRSCTSAS